jgi:hypothetical protein
MTPLALGDWQVQPFLLGMRLLLDGSEMWHETAQRAFGVADCARHLGITLVGLRRHAMPDWGLARGHWVRLRGALEGLADAALAATPRGIASRVDLDVSGAAVAGRLASLGSRCIALPEN